MENWEQQVNILLVDDNPSNLLALETILQASDRNLVRASSGEEALRFLLDDDAAVILLDVHMPSISGLETAALIRGRERTRDVPIIFLTAYSAGDLSVTQGYSLGAVDYIVKPIDPDALKSKVAVFVELYRKTEQIKRQADLLREQNIEIENANLQRLARLIDLGQRLAAERDPERVLESFCDAARTIMGARFATVGILEEDGVALRHFFTSGFDRAMAVKDRIPEACQRLLKERFATARSLRLPGVNGLRIPPEQTHIKSFVGSPILTPARQGLQIAETQDSTAVRGWLFLAEKIGAPAFSEADERFTVTLTQAVVFYENARLYADLQRHAAALEQEIADRKRAESERAEMLARAQAARAEAEEANRLKDEFLATVSHELRAPLNAMLGWVTLAREGRLDEASKERALETVERNARTQKKLVDDLLDVSSIITSNLSLDLEPTDLASIIESAVESVRPAAEAKKVSLQMDLAPMADLFSLDRNRFQQVVWNLVHNAIKFTPSGGAVKVRLGYPNRRAEIEVIDTGIGIASEFLPFVFDRFRQADGSITRSHGGLGLGLAIVRSLVEMHGGTIAVESAGLGKGATFRITLPEQQPDEHSPDGFPFDSPPPTAMNHNVAADSAPKLSGMRALVVDDESDARELLATVLSMSEAEVRTAGGVADAMRIITAWPPEIVIADIAMPGGGGYELIQRLRSEGIKAPAIAITAHAGDEDRLRALAAGFQMHMPKPVELYELMMSIASLTGRLT
ncbi:MAG: response regulator [Chloracidobacterium sp.]|nr:response regulator [Chloracidobacterium sp.]